MKTELEKRRRGSKIPHVYTLIVMALVVVLSWVVPSGEFARVGSNTGQMVVDQTILVMLKKLINFIIDFLPLYISVLRNQVILLLCYYLL